MYSPAPLLAAAAPAVVKLVQVVASVEHSSVPSHAWNSGVILKAFVLEKVR